LWNTNAKKVKVSDASELKEQLFRDEVPHRVSRGPDIVGDEGMASPRVDQMLLLLNAKRDVPSVFGGCQVFATENQFNHSRLVQVACCMLQFGLELLY
jgi:hypothetical protein